MKCRIEAKEYFNGFAGKKVLGLLPAEHLAHKLTAAGYEITNDAEAVFYDDMFYLNSSILVRGPDASAEMYDGIHTGLQFHDAIALLKRETNINFINNGVVLLSINDTYIDVNVKIGAGTTVYPNTYIFGESSIGADCTIGPDSVIESSVIGKGSEVLKSVVRNSKLGSDCIIGPFAHIRPDNIIGDRVKVGAYAEIKKSEIGDKTVIPHLAYIGDSEIGRNCNIACGVITANYDGKVKSKTQVGDNAFIGCNTTLIAPVSVGKDTYVAAGSTITDDVSEGALAIARNRQINKEGWVEKTNRKRKEKV